MTDRSRNGVWRILPGLAASALLSSLVALGAVSAPAGATAPPAWAVVSSPNATGSTYNDLVGTSCVGSFCVAVGGLVEPTGTTMSPIGPLVSIAPVAGSAVHPCT